MSYNARLMDNNVCDIHKQKANAKSEEMQPTWTYCGHETKHGNSVYLFPQVEDLP